jgi:hypothetical protein
MFFFDGCGALLFLRGFDGPLTRFVPVFLTSFMIASVEKYQIAEQ